MGMGNRVILNSKIKNNDNNNNINITNNNTEVHVMENCVLPSLICMINECTGIYRKRK